MISIKNKANINKIYYNTILISYNNLMQYIMRTGYPINCAFISPLLFGILDENGLLNIEPTYEYLNQTKRFFNEYMKNKYPQIDLSAFQAGILNSLYSLIATNLLEPSN